MIGVDDGGRHHVHRDRCADDARIGAQSGSHGSALISFGGVMVVNGVVSMTLIYILWNLKII